MWPFIRRASSLVITGVFTILDITSRVDAVQNYKHSEETWKQALGWLLTTPPWVPSLIFIVIFVMLFRDLFSPHPAGYTGQALDIIFDASNPGRRFFDIEPAKDETGKFQGHTYWEYRVAVINRTDKTIKNVSLTVEAIGMLPKRPEQSRFDMNRESSLDLHPGEEKLAVLTWWYNPPIMPGLALGPGIYGPIKATVHADDTHPFTKIFGFEPGQHPMVYEIEPPKLWFRRTNIAFHEWFPERGRH